MGVLSKLVHEAKNLGRRTVGTSDNNNELRTVVRGTFINRSKASKSINKFIGLDPLSCQLCAISNRLLQVHVPEIKSAGGSGGGGG